MKCIKSNIIFTYKTTCTETTDVLIGKATAPNSETDDRGVGFSSGPR